jgi:hypothetical protein
VSPVKYEQGFYIPEDGILHSHRRENLKSYMFVTAYGVFQPFFGIVMNNSTNAIKYYGRAALQDSSNLYFNAWNSLKLSMNPF